MKKTFLIFSTSVMISMISVVGNASANYLYTWSDTPDIIAANEELKNATDILAAWHATDGAYHYFRIDIESAPDVGDYADIYGIYIDAMDGGNESNISYVPQGLYGIDYIVDSHFNPYIPTDEGWYFNDFHTEWNGTIYETRSEPIAVQQTMNGGTTIEWQINVSDIGSDFTWRAATHMLTEGDDTRDITVASTFTSTSDVPVPGSIVLLGAGLAGFTGIRKRKKV